MENIAIIAGRGNFPILAAKGIKSQGYGCIAICIKANTPRQLPIYTDKSYWLKITEFGKMFDIFKEEKVKRVVMAGQINPYFLFNPKIMADPKVKDFFGQVADRRADTVFKAFADQLHKNGLELIDSTSFLSEHMPGEAVLTKRTPTREEYKDIDFGFKIAKHLGAIDIGQSVCVKDGVALALEAIEGTDNAIRRGAALSRQAIVLVKASKPKQDMRFDVPVVGLRTIRNLPPKSCLAIEAGRTLFFNLKESVILADKKGIAILSVG